MEKINVGRFKISVIWVFIIIFGLSGCKTIKPVDQPATFNSASKINTPVTWEGALKKSFRSNYNILVESHAKSVHRQYPVITQDLLNMTLIPSVGEKIRFKMDSKAYFTLAHTSHTPLAVYSILRPVDFKVNTDSTLTKLRNYESLLHDATKEIINITHLNKEQKQRIFKLLRETENYISRIITDKKTTKADYANYAESVRPLVEMNLHDGAMEQLVQFKTQMEQWKQEFPDENWNELRVAVMGFHQPRDLYALKLFFQWLLDEPEFEQKVVYAEFQFSIFGEKNRAEAEKLALELLTKVDLEKEASLFLLGDENLLQKDVMGPAAKEILDGWGDTKWLSN